ncbi:small ribosomal subunit Rsm22 family protein, partial [Treponema sp. R6D11]
GKNFSAALTAASEAEVGASAASKVATENCAWKVNTVKEKINLKAKTALVREKAALVCAVNLFNEMYEDLPQTNSEALKRMAENAALLMRNQAKPEARIFTVEPGVPQSGHFISFLRSAFLEMDRAPLSPCTHSEACPMPGGKSVGGKSGGKAKARWCHFAFDTADAPKELIRLSSAAGIPKERLVLSYLLVGAEKAHNSQARETAQTAEQVAQATQTQVRVISDAFPLPSNKYGRYGCSSEGLVLLTGDKISVEKAASGELVQ